VEEMGGNPIRAADKKTDHTLHYYNLNNNNSANTENGKARTEKI
jgi:hypothetical protein